MAKASKTVRSDLEESRAEAQLTLWTQLQRFSRDLIYSTLMRAGGEPFGAPFEAGVPSLTEKIVRRLRQKSFFSFETLEHLGRRRTRNKYTRHGAAPYRGPYAYMPSASQGRGFVERFLRYLRDNRFFLTARSNGRRTEAPLPKK